jgi:transcriptional regulator with XRE-family HTH domain
MHEHHTQELSHVGRLIHDYRVSHNLSRQEMADLFGISLTTLNRIKSGELSANIDTVIRISSVLGVSIEELVGLPEVTAVPQAVTDRLAALETLATEQAATISAQQSTINTLTAEAQSKDTQLSLYADMISYHKDINRRNDLFCKILLALVLLVTLVFVFVGL